MIARWKFFLLMVAAAALPVSAQDTPPVPEDFTRIVFEGHGEAGELLTNYLWYHFYNRGGNGTVLFNQEYLTTADLWLGNAREKGNGRLIQHIDRANLLAMKLDDEGYVLTNQHFSHAHDYGWPFPLWTQNDQSLGRTVGWHFQPLDAVPGWVGDGLRHTGNTAQCGEEAAAQWTPSGLESLGIMENAWRLRSTGARAVITSPAGLDLDAFKCPYFQLRWKNAGDSRVAPRLEWRRTGDSDFSPSRAMDLDAMDQVFNTGFTHSIAPLYRHPEWQGPIDQIRFVFPGLPGEAELNIDAIFSAFDTRHTINNPIYILANHRYFSWTRDVPLLRENINKMRLALRYAQTVLGGLDHNHIRNPWPGHDGLPGWVNNEDGTKTSRAGHGIGNNYWDLMPFGWDDFYATYQYYAATLAMAELEEAIQKNPGWNIPGGPLALDAHALIDHAAAVKQTVNQKFWNPATGRFYAAIDKEGKAWEYGYTFLNLDAIWYGIASDEHAASILDWIAGDRIVEEDTAQGADIYHWRFGPRASTKRNLEWYGHGWTHPENIPWGGQVQDGGAVLGFTFYDLWARLHHRSPDDAWQRLMEILDWEKEVQAAGGYRAYYADGKQGTTLQGGGTAGGLGIDFEFYESSLLPAIVPYGFAGLTPSPEGLRIAPKLPEGVPSITILNLHYAGAILDLKVSPESAAITVHTMPGPPLTLRSRGAAPQVLNIPSPGDYVLNLN